MRKPFTSYFMIALATGALSLLSINPCSAEPKVTVGASVPADQQVSMDQIDPCNWDALLKRYVDENGNVNYVGWKQSAEDMHP